MFHISTLGGFGCQLRTFADLDGFVPEPGDRPNKFRWDEQTEWNAQNWKDFVNRASKKTQEVLQLLELWREAS